MRPETRLAEIEGPSAEANEFGTYRSSEREQARIRSLMGMIPADGREALDIGARDGYFSMRLTSRFASVTALDLEKPGFVLPGVVPMAGDVTRMALPDSSFDLVLCAEVLEHIPPASLSKACAEISRVTRKHALIGVPFRQDLRFGRTVCPACKGKNPPWGHVNTFDVKSLRSLFPGLRAERIEFVGSSRERTNFLSSMLMDFAGNPYGTYDQEEPCIHCGSSIWCTASSGLAARAARFAAVRIDRMRAPFLAPRPLWIHVLFSKTGDGPSLSDGG